MSVSPCSPLRGFLIDDDIDAAQSAKRFSSSRLQLEFLEPGALEEFATKLFEEKPAIILLDYRLDERAGTSGVAARYKASALAQQLRDLAGDQGEVDFPIVLHSAEEKIRQLYLPEKTAHDLFDAVVYKGIKKPDEFIANLLDGLAEGYQRLIAARPYEENLLGIFGLTEDAAYLIDHQEIKHVATSTNIPHVFARFILSRLVRRNSILCDEATVLARCGIDASDSQGKSLIFAALASAQYSGVFSGAYPVWWRLLCDATIDEWLAAPLARLTASERVRKLSDHFGHAFSAAVSSWSKSSDERFTHACTVCSKPTQIAHSVSVFEHTSGPLTERRRICFDCLQLDAHLKHPALIIDELDRPTEEAVRRGDLARS